jgi:tRNA-binding EMAP/Myf-like protein
MLTFQDSLDVLLEMKLCSVAEQVYTMLYGKSQLIQQKVVAKEKIIPRNIPQIESISYICCGEAYEKTSKFEKKFA